MHYPHMGTHEGRVMTSEHHVVVSWSGSAADSKPMIELLEQAGYAFTVKSEAATHLEIVVESESTVSYTHLTLHQFRHGIWIVILFEVICCNEVA